MSKNNKSVKVNFIMNAILNLSAVIFPLITFPYVSRILTPTGTGRVSSCCGAGDIFRHGCTAWYPYLRYPCMCDRQG